jgi:hypothetical protein
MTGYPDITPLFLEIAACPDPMRRAITEACGKLLEGIGPSFVELNRYLREINEPSPAYPERFAHMWDMQNGLSTVEGVVHFLSSGTPDARESLDDILKMATGTRVPLADPPSNKARDEIDGLNMKELFKLKNILLSGDNSREAVVTVLDTVPAVAMDVLGISMSGWENSDERNLTLPDNPSESRVINGWLVHNSDKANRIYEEGFRKGNPVGYLAYGKDGRDDDDVYAFAYLLKDAPAPGERTRGNGLKYTFGGSGASVVFRGSGNVVNHAGDAERQVIFDKNEPTGCFLVAFTGEPGIGGSYDEPGWGVYGKNPGRPLVSGRYYRDCLDWIERNGDLYSGQMKNWEKAT